MRSSQQAMAVAAAALSESTPGAIGIRTAVASSRSESDSPDRSEPISTAARSPGSTPSSGVGVGVGGHGEQVDAGRARAMSSTRVVVRAWGSANAVPMATRSERRASGSALVWSRIRPSQPSPAALRMIAPTLAGLSTASRTTMRRQRAASSRDARASGSMEQRDDRLRHTEARHDAAHLVAPGVDR